MSRKLNKTLRKMKESPRTVRFRELCRICDHYFGTPRQTGGSHRLYRTPWAGDPRVNVQEGPDGTAKTFQIKQVLAAIERIKKKDEHQE